MIGRAIRGSAPLGWFSRFLHTGAAWSLPWEQDGSRISMRFLSSVDILCRMSGIATATHKIVELARAVNPRIDIYATRKTTPGFRWYEKKAVTLGGGKPHRFALYDAVLIKDNHIKCAGSVTEAINRVKQSGYKGPIEIETETIEDAMTAVESGVDIILLDNMSPAEAKEAYRAIKSANPNVKVEISGGITPDNIVSYANSADIVSLGYLTHSAKAVDFSLELL